MKPIILQSAFPDTGAENLTVSPIALGIARFGGYDREAENHTLLDRYSAAGGNLIDTALVYGRWVDETRQSYSERILGSWLDKSDHRERAVVSTKGAHPLPGTTAPRVRADCIDSDIGESMVNLRTKHIDLYFLHRDDESVPVSEIMDALNRHAADTAGNGTGLNLLGASNWTAARIYQANDYCVQHHMRGFDVSQICFNIIRTTPAQIGDTTLVSMTDDQLSVYRDLGMPVMAFTAQAGGFVSKFYHTPDDEIRSPYACEETFARMRRIRAVCEAERITPTAVTLGYLRGQSITVIPIVGVSGESQLDDCMTYADFALTPEQIAFIDGQS
ncbi:MAG: aldo/keto reductase [Eubacteriales bacterium]